VTTSRPSRSPRDMVLVVDFGTTETKATLLVPADSDPRPVTDPVEGDRSWPSTVYLGDGVIEVGALAEGRREWEPMRTAIEFKRDLGRKRTFGEDDPKLAWEVTAELLKAVKEKAQEMVTEPVDRLLITCPGDYRIGVREDERWADLDRACRAAGFVDIEYLHEPVAAAYAPIKRGAIDSGQIVLVYDFGGGTFDAAIVRIGLREHEVLAADSVPCGGADIDALLVEEIRRVTGATAVGDDRRDAELKATATEAKKKLSLRDSTPVAGTDDAKVHRITRERLDELLAGNVRGQGTVDRTLALARKLIDDLNPLEPDVVLAVGGSTRIPLVKRRLEHLGYPVREPMDVSCAVVDGAVAWARLAADRSASPEQFVLDHMPLRWPIPGGKAGETGEATVSSWLAQPGDHIEAGDAVVRVSLPSGELWDLRADRPGTLAAQHYEKDDKVRSTDWLATLRPLVPGSSDATIVPRLWREIPGPLTAAALSVDGRYVATANEQTVTVYDLDRWKRIDYVNLDAVEQLVFAPGGQLIAAHGSGFMAFDAATGKYRWSLDVEVFNSRVAPSPDGQFLAVSSVHNNTVQFFSAEDQVLRYTAELSYGYGGLGTCQVGTYSPDGSVLVPVSYLAAAPVQTDWDSGPEIVPGDNVAALAIRPQDNLIFGSPGDTQISVYQKENFAARPASPVQAAGQIRSLAFNRSGTLLACGLATGRVELRFWQGIQLTASVGIIETGSTCFLTAFTPDGYSLVTGSKEKLAIWSLADAAPPLTQPCT
jgi:WD40 repeat protein